MTPKPTPLPRPTKRSEYQIILATREAEKGWQDLLATARNAATDAWYFLTSRPNATNYEYCYRLSGRLSTVRIHGIDYERWQYKPTKSGRIWYAIAPAAKGSQHAGTVLIERVTTGHPNQTVKRHR
jgi:hypothetical protein